MNKFLKNNIRFVLLYFFLVTGGIIFMAKYRAVDNSMVSRGEVISAITVSEQTEPIPTLPTLSPTLTPQTLSATATPFSSMSTLTPTATPFPNNTAPTAIPTDVPTAGIPTPTQPPADPMSTVASHSTRSNCWLIINGNVYNITGYFGSHPGGDSVLLPYCGKDATAAFDSKGKTPAVPHSSAAVSLLGRYLIQ